MITPLTLQEVFNRIWERSKDKTRAVMRNHYEMPKCVYRHPDNPALKCFIGIFIPDDEYDKNNMEGRTAMAVVDMSPTLGALFSDCYVDALMDLQSIHDEYPPEEWDYALREFAVAQGLTVPE